MPDVQVLLIGSRMVQIRRHRGIPGKRSCKGRELQALTFSKGSQTAGGQIFDNSCDEVPKALLPCFHNHLFHHLEFLILFKRLTFSKRNTMVAQTKLSPALVVMEDSRRSHTDSQRNDSKIGYYHLRMNSSLDDVSNADSKSFCRSESFCSSLTCSSPTRVAPAPDSARVRARFLNRLGISPPQHQIPSSRSTNAPRSQRRQMCEDPFQEDLKDPEEKRMRRNPLSFFRQSSSSISSSNRSGSKSFSEDEKSVSFSPSVIVHPIPKHTAYSSRIRETMWTNPTEMQESAARNCLEFAAENWDWRQVADDQDMVSYHGELVHPVHFAHEYNIRRQFCAVMSAQSQASR